LRLSHVLTNRRETRREREPPVGSLWRPLRRLRRYLGYLVVLLHLTGVVLPLRDVLILLVVLLLFTPLRGEAEILASQIVLGHVTAAGLMASGSPRLSTIDMRLERLLRSVLIITGGLNRKEVLELICSPS